MVRRIRQVQRVKDALLVDDKEGRLAAVEDDLANFDATSTFRDAFGRLRTSNPQVLGFGAFEYGLNSLFVESATSGSGAVSSTVNESSLSLTTGGGTSGHYAYAQTRVHHRYVPGRSQLIRFTGSFGTPKANCRQRAGYFNARNGVFLEIDGTSVYFVRRTYTSGAAVDTRVARSSWTDPFDGTGPSGINLDLAGGKTWLCWVDLEWLGVGRYRFGFASPTTGELVTAYTGAGTNLLVVPYLTTANLPVRYEVENTGAASGATTMKWICYAVDTEGGDEGQIPSQVSADSVATATALASGTFRPILGVRADTVGPNSVPNRGQAIVEAIGALVTGTNPVLIQVVLNPSTLTQAGGPVTWANLGSITEYARFTNAADTIGGGTVLDSFYVAASASAKSAATREVFRRLPLVYTELGSVQDTLVVAGAGVGGTSNVLASVTLTEVY